MNNYVNRQVIIRGMPKEHMQEVMSVVKGYHNIANGKVYYGKTLYTGGY